MHRATHTFLLFAAIATSCDRPSRLPETATDVPRMVLSAHDVAFRMSDGALPPAQHVRVVNGGGGTLARPTVSVEYTGAAGWLSVAVTSSEPYSIVLQPVVEAISGAWSFASLTIRSPGVVEPRTLHVSLSVDPEIQLSTGLVRFQTAPGTMVGERRITATPLMLPHRVGGPTAAVTSTWSGNAFDCTGWLEVTVDFGSVWLTPVNEIVAAMPAPGRCVSDVEVTFETPAGTRSRELRAELSMLDSVGWDDPLVEPSTPSLGFSALAGGDDPPAQSFTVANATGGLFAPPALSTIGSWLTATLSGEESPGAAVQPPYTVTVEPRVAGLAAGTYQGTVFVSEYPVAVTLRVTDWAEAGHSLQAPLVGHTATALPDGTVLVVGEDMAPPESSFEVYDPAAAALQLVRSSRAAGALGSSRVGHTATALPDGRVVAAGGVTPCCRGGDLLCGCDEAVGTWEIYEPATGTWRISRPLGTARFGHTATALADGKVLVAGGRDGRPGSGLGLESAELLDADTGSSSPAGSLAFPRLGASAVRLADGKVLVAGGSAPHGAPLATSEVFDPALGGWFVTGNMNEARAGAALVLLDDGRVLAAGGGGGGGPLASAEVYDPVSGTWSPTASMKTARIAPAVQLPSGKVLLVGGATGGLGATATAERYDPATRSWSSAGALRRPRSGHTLTLLPSGSVLVTGGTPVTSSAWDVGRWPGIAAFEIGGRTP
jgi:hypothetical protein